MAKKRTPEQRLAEAIRDLGTEKAEAYFKFYKDINTLKTDPKPRKKLEPNEIIMAASAQRG